MKKSYSTLAVLHTVNLFLQLRSPTPPAYDISEPGRPHIPRIYERDDSIPILTVPEKRKQLKDIECKDYVNTAPHMDVTAPRVHLQIMEEGMGGTCSAFLVDNAGDKGIFKPLTGEGRSDQAPLKRGVTFGDTTAKEIAAFTLGADFDVPVTKGVTTLIEGQVVYGSLQKFVAHKCAAEDMGSSSFSLDEVQKIGILDIRLLNLDRHLNNLLVVEGENGNKLIPIDHGYVLPSYRDLSDVYFGWTYWKQCKESWTVKAKNTIKALQPLTSARNLFDLGISNDSILASTLSSLLLQHAAETNISLYQLAVYMQSDLSTDEPSGFEVAIKSTLSSFDIDNATEFDFSNADNLPHPNWVAIVENFLLLTTQCATIL